MADRTINRRPVGLDLEDVAEFPWAEVPAGSYRRCNATKRSCVACRAGLPIAVDACSWCSPSLLVSTHNETLKLGLNFSLPHFKLIHCPGVNLLDIDRPARAAQPAVHRPGRIISGCTLAAERADPARGEIVAVPTYDSPPADAYRSGPAASLDALYG